MFLETSDVVQVAIISVVHNPYLIMSGGVGQSHEESNLDACMRKHVDNSHNFLHIQREGAMFEVCNGFFHCFETMSVTS